MRSLTSIAAIAAGVSIAFAGSAMATDQTGKIAFWAQNDNALPGGGFGFVEGDFPQAADNGDGNGFLTTTFPINNIRSFAGTNLGWPSEGKGDPTSGGSIAFENQANNGQTFTLNFDASQYLSVNLSFAAQRTSTGFNNIDIVGGADSYLGNTWPSSFAVFSFDFDSLAGNSNASITFTLDGATSSSGNNRYDNILLTGKVIPTPGAVALFGLAGVAGLRRRRA
ncbi:MAG: hypothetical protein EA376_04765 [Phycisphaeraceae bacterium]|nr:MAG: hypothetical protein EA376_04765 [Phycisphaeraceae bacterium]